MAQASLASADAAGHRFQLTRVQAGRVQHVRKKRVGTTDARLALAVLNTLRERGIQFALLHGRGQLLEATDVTDVDAVVGLPVEGIVRQLKRLWISKDLHPVVVCPYDLAGVTVWCATRNAADAVQMDFLYDPARVGRLGVDTRALLQYTDHDHHLPQVRSEAQLLYLWRKRMWKGQRKKLEHLRADAMHIDATELDRASLLVTGSHRTAHELRGRRPLPSVFNMQFLPISRLRRILARLRRPVGFWVHAADAGMAKAIADRFGRFLPRCELAAAPTSQLALWTWYARVVQPIRLRPGLLVSYGFPPQSPSPDLMIGGGSAEEACGRVVSAMAARY